MSKRKDSSIYPLRVFHNWIKRQLITQATKYLRESYHVKTINLLDLSSGKGNDNQKWADNDILEVYGFDIDKNSVAEAKQRFHSLLKNTNKKLSYNFFAMDLSNPNNIPKINSILGNKKFNIITCNFAIHYFFKNKTTLDTLIKIASQHIAENGFFIGTTMDGDKIKELLLNNDAIKNNLFRIIKGGVFNNSDYGNKYIVSLGKETDSEHYFAKNDSEEYLVSIEELKKICEKYGLMFLDTIDFNTWYAKYVKEDRIQKLSDDEKEFSFLNFSFVFMKKS